MRAEHHILAALLAAFVLGLPSAHAADGNWQHYGNDSAGTRYSPLSQITPANVKDLKLVWRYKLKPPNNPGGGHQFIAFEATPIKVGDGLYFCTPDNVVVDLDAETGKPRWVFNPKDRKWTAFRVCRGVAYYRAPQPTKTPPADAQPTKAQPANAQPANAQPANAQPTTVCRERILATTTDARLFALDAKTGKPCPDFGNHGVVNLLTGLGPVKRGVYMPSSAPTVVNGVVVIGAGVTDNGKADDPSGVIRAYDAITGKLVWAWDLGHPDWQGAPPPGQDYTRDTPNGWAPFSADTKLGLVYIPTGNSNPDYYGGNRTPAENKYSSSVVALDAATGQVRWSFQTTHHDLWDYDVGSQPVLVNLPTAHGIVPALVQATKRGEVFLLDRRDGHPLTKVVEKPVPQGNVPGDQTAKTQPFSAGMPSLAGPPVTAKSMWGLTPLDQLWCRIAFRKARYAGPMTPPTAGRPWIYSPGWMGGMDWSSVSVDLTNDIMVATTMHIANYDWFVTHKEAKNDPGAKVGVIPQDGSPYFGIHADYFHSPLGVPCQSPPYGRLNAVDLKTHKLLWSVPLGTSLHAGPLAIPFLRVPFAIPMGTVTMGGDTVTKSGLVFIGAALDQYFRAYDIHTGKMLWRTQLAAPAFATPTTYISPESGRQFVVVAVGGFNKYGPNNGLYLDAFALPKKK